MPRVEVATPAMFDDLYPLLVQLDPARSEEQWRRIVYDWGWRGADDIIGYVLMEKQAIVGFLGTLYSRRLIEGKAAVVCNHHSWVVQEAFRGHSLSLVMTALRVRDCTLLNLTARPAVGAMYEKLGFKRLEQHVRLLFPAPAWPRLSRNGDALITADRSAVAEALPAAELKIFTDHAGCACGHVVVRAPEGSCYLVFASRRDRKYGLDIPYSHVHYISNPDLFVRHAGRINLYFLKTFGSWFVAVDERLLGGRAVGFSTAHRLTTPRYYRSEDLAADQLDNLYTELVVW